MIDLNVCMKYMKNTCWNYIIIFSLEDITVHLFRKMINILLLKCN